VAHYLQPICIYEYMYFYKEKKWKNLIKFFMYIYSLNPKKKKYHSSPTSNPSRSQDSSTPNLTSIGRSIPARCQVHPPIKIYSSLGQLFKSKVFGPTQSSQSQRVMVKVKRASLWSSRVNREAQGRRLKEVKYQGIWVRMHLKSRVCKVKNES
jgi:hypothetical protein